MIKNIGLLIFIFSLSLVSLSNNNMQEILEQRIENKIQIEMRSIIKADYDVDIYRDIVNVEIELKGFTNEKNSYHLVAEQIASIVREETGITNVNISIEKEKLFSKSKLVYSKKFSERSNFQ